jgi:hypothetical protein
VIRYKEEKSMENIPSAKLSENTNIPIVQYEVLKEHLEDLKETNDFDDKCEYGLGVEWYENDEVEMAEVMSLLKKHAMKVVPPEYHHGISIRRAIDSDFGRKYVVIWCFDTKSENYYGENGFWFWYPPWGCYLWTEIKPNSFKGKVVFVK